MPLDMHDMGACYEAFVRGIKQRDSWYGISPEPWNPGRKAKE